jgi:aspartyl-tRNA(Asn)/glutamyl-tRNA(Gln) amidotransferase subunit B
MMTRISIVSLRRYLLSGQHSRSGCHILGRGDWPLAGRAAPVGPLTPRPHLARSQSTAAQSEILTSEEPVVPLRKKLKDEAKQLKKQAKTRKSKGSNQVVDDWELTVGIEIHAQLNTPRKLFSPAVTSFNDRPNSHVALFDVAIPGSQPLFQKETLVPAVRAALALNCDIRPVSRFDRKHYFWWDQPSGYQITQYYEPFARNGRITLYARDGIAAEDGDSATVRIKQIQLEQDTSKTLAQTGAVQWLDFNRVGVPLIEIITEPEIRHPRTAAVLVRKIQLLLNAVDACVSGMETGGLRADVNVSVRRAGDTTGKLGTRTEIKNLSTIKAVEDAIIAERDRQIQEIEAGNAIVGETRGWTLGSKQTRRLRGKEGEVDYRYMPDPDLAPLVIGSDLVNHLRESVAVSPDAETDALVQSFGLTPKDAVSLVNLDNGSRVEYFYNVVEDLGGRLAKGGAAIDQKSYAVLAGNWILHELGRLTADRPHLDADDRELTFTADGECHQIPSSDLSELLCHLYRRKITGKVAKELLLAMYLGTAKDGVTAMIEAHDLWFRGLSGKEYAELARAALDGEDKVLREFHEARIYPQGKLMFLVGKMLRLGPTERIDPEMAEKAMRAQIQQRP